MVDEHSRHDYRLWTHLYKTYKVIPSFERIDFMEVEDFFRVFHYVNDYNSSAEKI